MAALVWPPCTTEVTGGLCVFPCFAVPHSIIRYQRVKCSMAGLATFYQNNAPALARRGWLRSAYNFLCLNYIKCFRRLKNVPDEFPHCLEAIRKIVSDWFYK
jgi:hypothetical protein